MNNTIEQALNNCNAGTSVIVLCPNRFVEVRCPEGKRFSHMDMIHSIASQGMTYSGETLFYLPLEDNLVQVYNHNRELIAIIPKYLYDDLYAKRPTGSVIAAN